MFSDYYSSLTANIQNVLVSCFRPNQIFYVRSTFHYRTVCELQNSFDPTAFCCAFSFAAVFCLQCANMRNSTYTLSTFVTHFTFFSPSRDRRQRGPAYDYITASNQLVKLPCKYYCISFYLSGYIQICSLYFILVSIITVGTRSDSI